MRPSHLIQARERSARLVAFVLALALAGFIAPGGPRAVAAPLQDVLGLVRLQVLLDESPDGVPGHFWTVLGGPTVDQQSPTELPLTVLSVVPDAGPAGDLVLVRLDVTQGPMEKIGNIAAGMSGSPVWVEDKDGVEKLIGALSMGSDFTTDGLALATPIEDMQSVENAGLFPASGALRSRARDAAAGQTSRPIPPVTVDGRTISRVVVASPGAAAKDAAKAAGSGDPSTAYFTPLMGIQIGGLPAKSEAYSRLEKMFVKHGLRVLAPHGNAATAKTANLPPALVPGSSAGTFYSVGDLSVGAIGTVTYTTQDDGTPTPGLVAFGHPLDWLGPTAAFFTSAWIDGVWSSSWSSFKLGSPGSVMGTLVQDRAAGVGARLDKTPAGVPVTASATVSVGGQVVSRPSHTDIAPIAFATYMGPDLAASAAIEPILRSVDSAELPGSAKTDLTIVVSDGIRDYTIHRKNLFDSDYDVQFDPGSDVYDILGTILSNPDGTTPASVKSVKLDTQVTTTRVSAEIRGIYSPGLHTGRNTLSVAVKPYGSKVEKRIPVTLTIPPGMPVRGVVTAGTGGSDGEEDDDSESSSEDTPIADRVAALIAEPANSDLVVEFKPEASDAPAVRSVVHTRDTADPYVFQGGVEATTSSLTVERSASPIVAGAPVTLRGSLEPAPKGATVKVERRTGGSSIWRTLDPAVPVTVEDDEATFSITDRPRFNSAYRISYAGSGGTVLGSTVTVNVAVRGRVAVAGVRARKGFALTATMAPKVAGSTVTFQRLRRGQWQTIKAVRTDAGGQARYAWRVKKGRYQVRAVLSGTVALSGNVSPVIQLRR